LIVCKEIPEKLKKFHQDWSSARQPWLDKAILAEEYFLNDVEGTSSTFTRLQSKKIKDMLNMNASLNFIYPLLDQKHAILTRSKPSHKVVPIGNSSKEMAYVLDKCKHAVMYNSFAVGEVEEQVRDMLISGMGIGSIVDEDVYQSGEFGIAYAYWHYSEVILDPNSRRRNGMDQRGQWTDVEIPIENARELYGDLIEEINSYYGKQYKIEDFAGGAKTTPKRNLDVGDPKQTVWVRNYYERVYSTVYLQEVEEGGDVNRIFQENFFPEEWDLLVNTPNNGIIGQDKGMFLKRYLILNDKVVLEQMKPIKLLPLHADYYQWGGSPYKSYGMVHFEKSKQDALDKAIHIWLINGMLTNNAGWKTPKGSIRKEDRKNWENNGAVPGIVMEYQPVVIQGKMFVPERAEIQQLSNFFPTLISMLERGMKISTSVNDVREGSAREAGIDGFSVREQYQDASMQRMMKDSQRINEGQEYLGNVAIQYLIATLKPDKTYGFLDDKGKFNEIKIAKEFIRDLKLGQYKVLATPAEAMPTQRLNMAIEMMKVAQSTPDPNKRDFFIQTAFSLSDMRAFDEIAEDLDKINELVQQIEGLQETIDRLKEQNKQYENQKVNAEIKAKIALKYVQYMEKLAKSSVEIEDDMFIAALQKRIKELESNGKES